MGNASRFVAFAAALIGIFTIAYYAGRSAASPAPSERPPAPARTAHDSQHAKWPAIAHRDVSAPTKPPPKRASQPLPSGPFGAMIDELKRRAIAGDASAALALGKGYRDCEFYQPPKDQAELEQRVEDSTVQNLNLLDQVVDQVKRRAAEAGAPPPPIPHVDSMDVYHERMQTEVAEGEKCAGVVHADAEHWRGWYGQAAALGDEDAMLAYWEIAFSNEEIASLDELREEKSLAASYLERAYESGDPRALAAIASVYRAGYYAYPDPFMAHAYFFAASQAANAPIETLPWVGGGLARLGTGSDTSTYYTFGLRQTAAELDASEIAQAEQLGATLYAQCCGGTR